MKTSRWCDSEKGLSSHAEGWLLILGCARTVKARRRLQNRGPSPFHISSQYAGLRGVGFLDLRFGAYKMWRGERAVTESSAHFLTYSKKKGRPATSMQQVPDVPCCVLQWWRLRRGENTVTRLWCVRCMVCAVVWLRGVSWVCRYGCVPWSNVNCNTFLLQLCALLCLCAECYLFTSAAAV